MDLSLGLFSSAGVDTGSMLLLKTIAGSIELDGLERVLDVGCGTGTLGLALASRCPKARVEMLDRDALAVSFTRHNALVNKLENVEAFTRLMGEVFNAKTYDLILSNFPAKAGEAVLEDYLRSSMSLLNPDGRCAIVIVYTLAARCRELIESSGGDIILEDESKQHTVFHYRREHYKTGTPTGPAGSDGGKFTLIPYIRHHGEFKLKRTRYELDTVWNIGDFDTHSWRIRLMGELLDAEPRKGTMVFWAPGQGHLPVAVCRRKGAGPDKVILADRDRLALLICEHNLAASCPELPVEVHPIADPSLLGDALDTDSADFLLTDLSPVPRSDWAASLKHAAAKILKSGGLWAILGRSADLATLTRSTKGWSSMADRRNRGWRAMIIRKN